MAKAPDVGMEKGDLKRLLNLSKGEAVNCAIGLGGDGATGLVMLHKIKGPKAVSKELTDKFPDAKNPRWGTAQVDEEGVVRFMINKAAPGMARKLTKSLKGTGFNKVKMLLEDGTELEGAAEEDEEGAGEGAAGEGAAAEPQQAEAPVALPDLAELEKELRGLIGQIATAGGSDAARLTALKTAAGEAAGAVKAKDAAKAAEAVAKLKEAIGGASAGDKPAEPKAGGGDSPVSFVKMQKSRLLWDSARKRVAGEIAGLKKEALDLFQGDAEEAQVMNALDQLDEITSTLDDRLLDALDDLLNEQDAGKHAELLKDANEVLDDYAEFVRSNELVQKLSGDTPFGIKLSIGPTYASVIKALQANLH